MLASPKRSRRKQSLYEQSMSEEEASDEIYIVSPKERADGGKQKTFHAEKSLHNENGFFQDTTSSGRTLKSPSQPKVMHFSIKRGLSFYNLKV